MIYYINEKQFPKENTTQETYDDIVRFLNETSSIILGETGVPLDEMEIKDRLGEPAPIFSTKLISEHELEVLHSVLQFSKQLLLKVESLNLKTNEEILTTFSELSDTLLELSNVDSYFNFGKISKNGIEMIVKQVEQKIIENDYSSISEIIELIYSEWIEEFVEELEIRKGI